jgi:hypothetical protein
MTSKNADNSEEFGAFRAVANAFIGRDISFFPRFKGESDKVVQYDTTSMMREIGQALDELSVDKGADLESILKRTRESLNEVKSQTEYQDQKATRLLTIIAFLSALSGALFSRFVDEFPLSASLTQFSGLKVLPVAATYLLFVLFALSAVCGALVVFHATRTRFVWPALEKSGAAPRAYPRSFLFYSGIVEMRPAAWARSFSLAETETSAKAESGKVVINRSLNLDYVKNQIAESYLVAVKTADKLRYLEPAQNILAFAVKILAVWIVLIGCTMVMERPVAPSDAAQKDSGASSTVISDPNAVQRIPTEPAQTGNSSGSSGERAPPDDASMPRHANEEVPPAAQQPKSSPSPGDEARGESPQQPANQQHNSEGSGSK